MCSTICGEKIATKLKVAILDAAIGLKFSFENFNAPVITAIATVAKPPFEGHFLFQSPQIVIKLSHTMNLAP